MLTSLNERSASSPAGPELLLLVTQFFLPHKRPFARMRFGVLPHTALARKMLSTQLALVLAFGQVLRLMGYHLLVGVEALSKTGKRNSTIRS